MRDFKFALQLAIVPFDSFGQSFSPADFQLWFRTPFFFSLFIVHVVRPKFISQLFGLHATGVQGPICKLYSFVFTVVACPICAKQPFFCYALMLLRYVVTVLVSLSGFFQLYFSMVSFWASFFVFVPCLYFVYILCLPWHLVHLLVPFIARFIYAVMSPRV